MRGNTYDATHLDKFLSSGFGEKGLGSNVTATFQASLKREVASNNVVTATATPSGGAPIDQLAQGSTNNGPTSDSLYEPNSMDENQIANETTMM